MAALLVNSSFALESVASVPLLRIDGRTATDAREVDIDMAFKNGHARIRIGKTIVSVSVEGQIVIPAQDRPNEGRFFFNTEIGSLANPALYDNGKPTLLNVSLTNYVERVLRGSKAIDVESLCILGGKSVWSIRIEIHVLCDDGGLFDACSLAALCGIINFKRELVSVQGSRALQFSSESRSPIPFSMHHMPISSTFAIVQTAAGVIWLADPSFIEEQISGATMISIAVNQHGELCCMHKPGGIPMDCQLVSDCIEFAVLRAKGISAKLIAQIKVIGP